MKNEHRHFEEWDKSAEVDTLQKQFNKINAISLFQSLVLGIVCVVFFVYIRGTKNRPVPAQPPEPAPQVGFMLADPIDSMRHDFWATVKWEHRGVIRPNDIGDNGQSHGLIQAKAGYLQDANEWLAARGMQTYTLNDMKQEGPAFAVYSAYMMRYGAETSEERARTHNSLANRHSSFSDAYWAGVQTYL